MIMPYTFSPFNPALIRNYHFVKQANNSVKVQFIAIGDRHKMMKQDNGEILIIKQKECGKPYRYGAPFSVQDAVDILNQKTFSTHSEIAKHILDNVPSA